MHRHQREEWKILVRAILARHVSKGDLIGDGVVIGDDASISHENINPGDPRKHLSGLWEALPSRLVGFGSIVLGKRRSPVASCHVSQKGLRVVVGRRVLHSEAKQACPCAAPVGPLSPRALEDDA